ncbi:aminoacyl-tRNA deacylase [Enterococcus canis]|uniref:Cys-tRNA(Pro)/Cys-tRNA(Cys) deacylase n=1 Tax=Enterococcus canis TaxID=214095 RepID=A0A1L8RDL4_9ENTE|nr:aminoacyl-tRNA deacylase [Enterococcus canis]OJG17815.1 aminoacyl-tRNA deacylase [Enterococcus canis]
MAKKNAKTLVEKILDKHKIAYEAYDFPWQEDHHVAHLEREKLGDLGLDEHDIYKTLVLTGKNTGPLVAVIPIDEHLSYKKLSQVSGNKKVGMVPLKDLVATTGYEHGANTPVGIHEKYNYPIYLGQQAQAKGYLIVSSGKIGRSVKVDAETLRNYLGAEYADITE